MDEWRRRGEDERDEERDLLDRLSEDRPPSGERCSSALFLELFFLPCFRFRLFFLCLPFFFSFLCLGRLPDLPELRSEDCSGERDHAETLLSSHLLNEWSFSLWSQEADEGSRGKK